MPRIQYAPDKYSDGRYVIFKITDGKREEFETHYNKDYIEKKVSELNREVILNTLFDASETPKEAFPIFEAAKKLAEAVLINTPPSADQSSAIRSIREAVLWATQAILLEGYA